MPKEPDQGSEIVIYQTEDGRSRIQVRIGEETVWLSQRLLSELYHVGVNTINHHIKSIYDDGELSPEATVRQYRIVQTEGGRQIERVVEHYNRITVMFLDQAEFRAQRRQDIKMRDWEAFLDKFLRDTELPVLANAGSVSHEEATEWACNQYDAFAERRRLEAETGAEARYLNDLRTSAQALEAERKEPPTAKKKQGKRHERKGKRRPEAGGL
jgi:hypothetical protein